MMCSIILEGFSILSVAVGDLNRSSWNVRYDVDFPHMIHSTDNTTIELPKTHQGLFALRRIMSPRGTASINGHSLAAAPAMTRTSLTKAELLHLRLHASPKKLAQFARLYPDIGSGITMRDLNALHSCRYCSAGCKCDSFEVPASKLNDLCF